MPPQISKQSDLDTDSEMSNPPKAHRSNPSIESRSQKSAHRRASRSRESDENQSQTDERPLVNTSPRSIEDTSEGESLGKRKRATEPRKSRAKRQKVAREESAESDEPSEQRSKPQNNDSDDDSDPFESSHPSTIWSARDTTALNETTPAEITLWRRCHHLFGVSPHEILPDGTFFDNVSDYTSVTHLSTRTCKEASAILCCPEFDLRFFKHSVAVAMHGRLGEQYGRRSRLAVDVRNRKVAALMEHTQGWSEEMEKALGKALDEVLGLEYKHMDFLKGVKKIVNPKGSKGKEPVGAVARDFTSLVRAWDEYKQTNVDLEDTATYMKRFANPRGPKKDGLAHSQEALELKKNWIIKQRLAEKEVDGGTGNDEEPSSLVAKRSERSKRSNRSPDTANDMGHPSPVIPKGSEKSIPKNHRHPSGRKEVSTDDETDDFPRPVNSTNQARQSEPRGASPKRPSATKTKPSVVISTASKSESPPRWGGGDGPVEVFWTNNERLKFESLQLRGLAFNACDVERGPNIPPCGWGEIVKSRRDLLGLPSVPTRDK